MSEKLTERQIEEWRDELRHQYTGPEFGSEQNCKELDVLCDLALQALRPADYAAGIEDAAKVCDRYEMEAWDRYRRGENRGDTYDEGVSDGAQKCAERIRALRPTAQDGQADPDKCKHGIPFRYACDDCEWQAEQNAAQQGNKAATAPASAEHHTPSSGSLPNTSGPAVAAPPIDQSPIAIIEDSQGWPTNKATYIRWLREQPPAGTKLFVHAAPPSEQEAVAELKGKWNSNGNLILHDDFTYDVKLTVDGDWPDDRIRATFIHRLVQKLNSPARREDGMVPDVDWLANVIRSADGENNLGAGALAEKIVEAMLAAGRQS